MNGSHARAAISSLAMTLACPGSLQLQEMCVPLPPTEEELEGTAADIVAMSHAMGAPGQPMQVGFKFMSEGREWTVDQDMYDGAVMFAKAMGGPHGFLRVHDAVRATRIHPTDCWGTPDAWRFFPEGTGPNKTPVLRCGEYKYGHRFVDEFECSQLTGYLVGIMERLNLSDENLILEYIVVQPRCFAAEPVRIWRVQATDIRALVNLLNTSVELALSPNPPTATGDHCLDCRARHVCKTLRYGTSAIVSFAGHAQVAEIDLVSMAQELYMLDDAAKQLEARRTGVAAQVEAMLRAGKAVPLWEMAPLRSNRQWNEDVTPEHAAATFDMFGIDIRKPLSVITPTQAIDRGIEESIVMDYASRPTPKLGLKRVKAEKARKLFRGSPA